ncbi:MAG TPA: hypothetical protein VK629_05295 [Steroidobacteraceae bacterium]|nr:hypothetical protein [Steroidobacteraceae bacterium]
MRCHQAILYVALVVLSISSAVLSAAEKPAELPVPKLSPALPARDIVRLQAYFGGGQLRGYRAYPGKDHEAFACTGLQAGDLITAVGGESLTRARSSEEVKKMAEKLVIATQENRSSAVISVIRGGKALDVVPLTRAQCDAR